MIHTTLTEAQRSELQALRRTDLPAVVCDRLEMVLLSADGWSPPRIGQHLGGSHCNQGGVGFRRFVFLAPPEWHDGQEVAG
jgi:hypothetical protein